VVVAVVVVLLIQRQVQTVATVVLELSSSVMLAHNVVQVAHTPQLAGTQSTLLQQVERIRRKENHGSFCTN
jgi:hypothetical protein